MIVYDREGEVFIRKHSWWGRSRSEINKQIRISLKCIGNMSYSGSFTLIFGYIVHYFPLFASQLEEVLCRVESFASVSLPFRFLLAL